MSNNYDNVNEDINTNLLINTKLLKILSFINKNIDEFGEKYDTNKLKIINDFKNVYIIYSTTNILNKKNKQILKNTIKNIKSCINIDIENNRLYKLKNTMLDEYINFAEIFLQ